jgi:hypothetical protein
MWNKERDCCLCALLLLRVWVGGWWVGVGVGGGGGCYPSAAAPQWKALGPSGWHVVYGFVMQPDGFMTNPYTTCQPTPVHCAGS